MKQIIWQCQWHVGVSREEAGLLSLSLSLSVHRGSEQEGGCNHRSPREGNGGGNGVFKSMALCRVFVFPCDPGPPVRRDYLFCHSCHVYLSLSLSFSLPSRPSDRLRPTNFDRVFFLLRLFTQSRPRRTFLLAPLPLTRADQYLINFVS